MDDVRHHPKRFGQQPLAATQLNLCQGSKQYTGKRGKFRTRILLLPDA